MFKQMNSHWDDALLKALKLPEEVDLWHAELPQVWAQIKRSYSGSKIGTEGKVARPFEHRWGGNKVGGYPHGGHYVATGGMFGRHVDTYSCYLLTPRETFQGKVGTYRGWDWKGKRGGEWGSYHGMMVQWQKQPFVLTGPPLVWWRKGERFGELLEIVQAPAVQKIQQEAETPFLIKPVQMSLF